MAQPPRLDITKIGESEHIQEEDTSISPDTHSYRDDDHLAHDRSRGWVSFPCQDYEQCFNSQQGLVQHMHIHALVKNVPPGYKSKRRKIFCGSDLDQQLHENVIPSVSVSSVTQLESTSTAESLTECNMSPPDREPDELHQEENLQQVIIATLKHGTKLDVENNSEDTGQCMLDVSSSTSENLSFYFDGKIVSTSTVNACEAAEVHSACLNLVGLDTLILDPSQFSLGLNSDSILSNQELQGLAPAKRRTATPPLSPVIQTELESEGVVSSSSLVTSVIEHLLPQNTESTVAHPKGTSVFLSPKFQQLLEKQENVNPAPALLPDGQTPCSFFSTAAAGRFKRRTASPQSSPQHNLLSDEETIMPDPDGSDAVTLWQMDTQHSSTNEQASASQIIEEKQVIPILTENWSPVTVNNCSQQPLDLSNTMKRHDPDTSAALDLSLQKNNLNKSDLTSNVAQSSGNPNLWIEECDYVSEEQNLSLESPKTPGVTDFIVTGPNMVDPVAEGLVYGLAVPPCSLISTPTTLTPFSFPTASPCTISFESPTYHTVLPTAPSLITVLASALAVPGPSSQPIQILAPTVSPDPLVLCTENSGNSTRCDSTSVLAASNAANLLALSQPRDPSLNPGHMFLSDPIAFNPPINETNPGSEVPFTATSTLNDPLSNSYNNITSNTVLIECTISLESPVSVSDAVTMQNTDTPASTQMLFNHIEQQQIVSLPNSANVDPTINMPSIEESVTMSATTSLTPDCLAESVSNPDSEKVPEAQPPNAKEEEFTDSTDSAVETFADTSSQDEKLEKIDPPSNTPRDSEQQTFTKNFICNVCDQLFHSMKELGHHVCDHADEWPYKCEFCVLLFDKPSALLDHRSSLHGVDKTYVCSACTKDFVYFCNLKQHQEELHPTQQCTFTEEEKGKIRPQNYNYSIKVSTEPPVSDASEESNKEVKKEENGVDLTAEELFTTIKIMSSDTGEVKGPDVRLGINQHYPSFKPPPFPYHNRSPAGSLASATNFTTHNIPQTFSTAIRCTKCGKSFDNMPELHKHILACANASDKRRYTPKKNPIPLRHFAKSQNGVLSTANSANEFNASNGASQSPTESSVKVKFKLLNRKKRKLVQRVMPQRNKSTSSSLAHNDVFACPHCSREFTMRRSRTKHIAVCPKKPKEVRTRKEGGLSVTKENDGRLHRGVSNVEQKQEASPHRRTRLQTSGPTKRPTILPAVTSFSSKRMKFAIKDTPMSKNEMSTLNELPMVRSFNPPLRQYTRVHHGIKDIPVEITLVKHQTDRRRDKSPSTQSKEAPTTGGSSKQSAVA